MTDKPTGKSPAKRKRAPRKKKPASKFGPVITGSLATSAFAILLTVLSYFLKPNDGTAPPPPVPPDPTPIVSTEWSKAVSEFDKLGRRSIEIAITRLESGDLPTDQAAKSFVLESTATAFESAFTPMSTEDAKTFADGWSPEKHAKRLADIIGKSTEVPKEAEPKLEVK